MTTIALAAAGGTARHSSPSTSPAFLEPLRQHQRDALGFTLATPRLITSSPPGSGRTTTLLALLARLVQRGEVTTDRPAVMVVPPLSVAQHQRLTQQHTSGLRFAYDPDPDRVSDSHCHVFTPETLVVAARFLHGTGVFIIDPADLLRHDKPARKAAVPLLAGADRVVLTIGSDVEDEDHFLDAVGLLSLDGLGANPASGYTRRGSRPLDLVTGKALAPAVLGFAHLKHLREVLDQVLLVRTVDDLDAADRPAPVKPMPLGVTEHVQQADAVRRALSNRNVTEHRTARNVVRGTDGHVYSARTEAVVASLEETDGPVLVVLEQGFLATQLSERLTLAEVGHVHLTGQSSPEDVVAALHKHAMDPRCRVLLLSAGHAEHGGIGLLHVRHLIALGTLGSEARDLASQNVLASSGQTYTHHVVLLDLEREDWRRRTPARDIIGKASGERRDDTDE